MKPSTPLFVTDQLSMNALVVGVDEPRIFVARDAIQLLTPPEFQAMVEHELGHVAHDHLRHNLIIAMMVYLGAGCYLVAGEWMFAFAAFVVLRGLHGIVKLCQELDADLYAAMRTSFAATRSMHVKIGSARYWQGRVRIWALRP